jgi:hypothetical protein
MEVSILLHAPVALLTTKESVIHIAWEPLLSFTLNLVAVGTEKAVTISGIEHLFSGHSLSQ